ncbi:MAG: phosphoribosyl transferase [Omnitrophica bacterium GWA2_52_12]|nr:MAG: phosphoribosyl transferase [Omnitrophica bacterium GWA2_52_12]
MIHGFRNRSDGGRQLAQKLKAYANRSDVLVAGLARGGVVVAFEVALELNAPLDVFIVRKLGAPGQQELAMGAIAEGGGRVLNQEVVDALNISQDEIEQVAADEKKELRRRQKLYRGGRSFPDVRGKTVILVDDGLATGATMLAAVRALRKKDVSRIVAAVPVGAADSCATLAGEVEEMVCLLPLQSLGAIGEWYEEFAQTRDNEVLELLSRFHNV